MNVPKLIELPHLRKLNVTPLALLQVQGASVIVDVDDEHEQRIRLILRPYQALRMTTADCFVSLEGLPLKPQLIMEVVASEWLEELKQNLRLVDSSATFMAKARHFVFPLQDDFLEVAAWDIELVACPQLAISNKDIHS
jgi:hypothetical protein